MSAPSSTQWHAITPQTRPLTLSILELTPLAVTLALTLAPVAPNHPSTPGSGRKKKHQRRRESDDENATDDDHANTSLSVPGSWPSLIAEGTSFKDLLSHGVVLSVNGQPWNRIVAHVSDDDGDEVPLEAMSDSAEGEEAWSDMERAGEENESGSGGEEGGVTRRRPRRARFSLSAGNAVKGDKEARKRTGKDGRAGDGDRAVVVIYGLSPGKEYEIELKVVGLSGEDSLVSNAIVIPPSPSLHNSLLPRSRANSLRSRSLPRSRSNSINAAHPASPLGQDVLNLGTTPAVNGDISSATILPPLDSQAAQLRHLIATAHTDKEHLHAQIKEARRSSQRAEAALRVEIETVKKAIEKAGGMDMRAKQKALALQEQVKQGWAGAESAEAETAAVEEGMAELEARLAGVLQEVEMVRNEWKDVKDKEEEVREREKKMRGEEHKKLVEVVAKMDKLRARKEKKEAERSELEKRLEELEKAREEAERRNEEERHLRRTAAPHPSAHGARWDEWHGGSVDNGRSLSAHPSLTNLSGQYAAGPAYRPRGAPGYQPRFPSAGSARTGTTAASAAAVAASQASPTHGHGFYPTASPIPPSASATTTNTSPALRPAAPGSLRGGTNIAALPFHPSNHDPQQHHTALMPPQLQHRIYLAHHHHVRPRPGPTFHPPPSVVAEQQHQHHLHQHQQHHLHAHQHLHQHQQHHQHQHQQQQHQHQAAQAQTASLATPAFPPLPSQSSTGSSSLHGSAKSSLNATTSASGPSLASIVTRAVLSPTSALAQNSPSIPTPTSPTPATSTTSNTAPNSTPTSHHNSLSAVSTPPPPPPPGPARASSKGLLPSPSPATPYGTGYVSPGGTDRDRDRRESRDFPALSAGVGPWASVGTARSATPSSWVAGSQFPGAHGGESPAGSGSGSGSASGSGRNSHAGGIGGAVRKSTGDASS